MATFVPPFDPSAVVRQPDVLVTLPDPPRAPTDPIIRPGVARHAGVTLAMLDAVPAAAPFALVAPATGAVRHVALSTGGPGGLTELLELSPLPFAAARTLRALGAGVPTFYIGLEGTSLDDDDLVAASDTLATVTTHAYLGRDFGQHLGTLGGSLPAWTPAPGTATDTVAGLASSTGPAISAAMVAKSDRETRQRLFDQWVAGLAVPIGKGAHGAQRVTLTRIGDAATADALLLESPEPLPFSEDVTVTLATVGAKTRRLGRPGRPRRPRRAGRHPPRAARRRDRRCSEAGPLARGVAGRQRRRGRPARVRRRHARRCA